MADPLTATLLAGVWTMVAGAICSSKLLQKHLEKAQGSAAHLLSDNFPKNHVAARAALAAAVRSLKVTAKNEVQTSDVVSSRADLAAAAAFERRLNAWAAKWKNLSDTELEDQLPMALKASIEGSLLTVTSQEAGAERLLRLREQAVSAFRAVLIAELDPPQAFLDRFDGKGEGPGFFAGFAAEIAKELRTDTELSTIFQAEMLTDIRSQLETARAEIRQFEITSAKDLRQIAELVRELRVNADTVFFEPGISERTLRYSALRQFYFASEQDDFSGRTDEMALLWSHFLKRDEASPKFLWTAVCGGAGSGKSRLALQVKKLGAGSWPVGGFVRRAFIENVDQHLTSMDIFPGATLFILDYADLSPRRCLRLIERCAALAKSAAHPVRVLVLLRREDDPFFNLVENDADGSEALDTFLSFQGLHPNCTQFGALKLEGLEEAHSLELMRARMAWVAANDDDTGEAAPVKDLDDNALLALVQRYDHEVRPLYALIVADAFQRGTISVTDVSDSQEESRIRLFWEILERGVNRRWRDLGRWLAGGVEQSASDLDRHVSFLALSTLCRGIGDPKWESLEINPDTLEAARALLPRSHGADSPFGCPLSEEVLSLLSGGERGADAGDLYPTVQPDLLGEAFILLLIDQRGGSLAMEKRTQAARRSHLLNLAWAADPQGTAFFCALVDQDYPLHAAKYGWLLPDQLSGHAAAARMDLFSSLVRNTVTPLGRRAATLSDLDRMSDLIEKFRPLDTDTTDLRLQYLQGVEHMARQLQFIVNKSTAPRGANQIKQIRDPRQSALVTLTQAVNREIGGRQDENESDFSRVIFRNPSDSKTVDAALKILRRLYDENLTLAFSTEPYDIRREAASIVAWAVSSVFWHSRDQKDKFGYAETPLSEEETEAFDLLGQRCLKVLSSARLDESSLAVVCRILHVMVYAEQGKNKYRSRQAFEIIQRWADNGKFAKIAETSQLLSFLGNHTVLEADIELEKPEDQRSGLDAILNVADKMMNSVMQADKLDDRSRDSIALSYANVVRRRNIYDEESGRPVSKYLLATFETYFDFRERFGVGQIGTHEVSWLCQMIASDELSEQQKLGIIKRFARMATQGKFDRISFNDQTGVGLAYDIYWLLRGPEAAADQLASIIEALSAQIGSRFQDEWMEVIRNHYPDAAGSPLVLQACDLARTTPTATNISGDDREYVELVRVAQYLLAGNKDAILDKVEADWHGLGESGTLSDRADLFVQLRLVLAVEGLSAVEATAWRARILCLLNKEGARELSEGQGDTGPGDQALIELAETFSALEILAGQSGEDWLFT